VSFFLSEWLFPSLSAFTRKVGVTTPQALRCHRRRVVGSSLSAPVALMSGSSSGRATLAVESSGGRSGDWARADGTPPRKTAVKTSAEAPREIVLMAHSFGSEHDRKFRKPAKDSVVSSGKVV